MSTPSTPSPSPAPKQSAVSAFLGEAAAPEAVVKVEVTGNPQQVQKAITKLAKKPAKKLAPKSGGGEDEASVEDIVDVPAPDEGGEPDGDESAPPARPGPIDLDAEAEGVVESLIQEGLEESAAPAPAAPKK